MIRTIRFLAALAASSCVLLAFASLSSAQQVLYGANGASGYPSNLYLLDPSSGAVLQTGGRSASPSPASPSIHRPGRSTGSRRMKLRTLRTT